MKTMLQNYIILTYSMFCICFSSTTLVQIVLSQLRTQYQTQHIFLKCMYIKYQCKLEFRKRWDTYPHRKLCDSLDRYSKLSLTLRSKHLSVSLHFAITPLSFLLLLTLQEEIPRPPKGVASDNNQRIRSLSLSLQIFSSFRHHRLVLINCSVVRL